MIKGNKRIKKIKSSKGKVFTSKRVFLTAFFFFMLLVVSRFMAINTLETNEPSQNYLYQFNGDVFAEFYSENNHTFLNKSANIEIQGEIKDEHNQTILPPYSFIDLKLNGNKAVYQFLPDKKEHSVSFESRKKWFQIIGGEFSSKDGESLIRLKKEDKPSLLIVNSNLDERLDHNSINNAKSLKVIALREGFFYHSSKNEIIPIPVYSRSLRKILQKDSLLKLKNRWVKLDKYGYISNGTERIRIFIGEKRKSVRISKSEKKYNLIKVKTVNIAIVNNETSSSKLQLVYADDNLSTTKLSYNFIRMAHLLIKYKISNANETIMSLVSSDSFLQKELLDHVESVAEMKLQNSYLEKYYEKRDEVGETQKEKLKRELLKYIVNGDFYRAKIAIKMGADINFLNQEKKNLLELVLSHQKKYLMIPQSMKFYDGKLTIRGNKNVFKNNDYFVGGYFPATIPIFDKPRIPQKEYLNIAKLNEFVDTTHLNGIYISDSKSEVFYSKNPQNFVQKAIVDYKKSPPLFLYDGEGQGKFVAPTSNMKSKFYYKIKTKKSQIQVAFNGIIRKNGKIISKNYNKIVPFYRIPSKKVLPTYTVNIDRGEVVLEVSLENEILPCGAVFESFNKVPLQYAYRNNGSYKKFIIEERGDKYLYRLQQDASKPFHLYYLKVKSNTSTSVKYLGDGRNYTINGIARTIKYTPSLSCLAKNRKKEFLSLYDEENILELIPKSFQERGRKLKTIKKSIIDVEGKKNKLNKNLLSQKLLPIYGDGLHFGLTAKGVAVDELTLDVGFTKKVADIFENTIQPLKTSRDEKQRKNSNTILEGAVVVLEDKGDNDLSVVSMFSYPYPKNLNILDEESYKKEIFKYLLLDEFSNSKSSLRNRALDMRVRPGSTFKIVTAITGFKENVINKLDTKYRKYIEGKIDINNTKFKNNTIITATLKNYTYSSGKVELTEDANFTNSFKHSYNVYFGYLSLLLHHKLDKGFKKELYPLLNKLEEREKEFPLLGVANELGFNEPIYLSKEKNIFAYPSIFPSNFLLSKEVADSAIGQFEVAATPMQMAMVVNVIKNRNIVVPKIIKEKKENNILKKNFISLSAQIKIEKAMNSVVNGGSGKCAFYHNKYKYGCKDSIYSRSLKKVNPKNFSIPNVTVYGKTGTAEKGKGKLYDGWFVAYTKYSKKTENKGVIDKLKETITPSSKKGDIIVATVVRNSGTGGTYSATITKKIIEAWYAEKMTKKDK